MALTLLLAGCFSAWQGDEGTITISLGGGGGRSAMPWPPDGAADNFLDKIDYEITMTGSSTIEFAAKGGAAIRRTVPAGRYTVTVKAFLEGRETPVTPGAERVHYATGSADAPVEVKAGQTNLVTIKMIQTVYHKVTFDYNYPAGEAVERYAVTGGKVTAPENPKRNGYIFTGWNTEEDGTGAAFTAETPVTGDITVYAQWVDFMGSGTAGDPYLIENEGQLIAVRYALDKHFRLENDLDLSDSPNWKPIGGNTDRFTGVFDGNGKIISGLTITNSDGNTGLFGYVRGTGYGTTTGIVRNLGLTSVSIDIGNNRVGGIAGQIHGGLIENCFVDGSLIRGMNATGGIVGSIQASGTVKNCYTTIITVSGNGYPVGGIVGENYNGTVSYCFSTSAVSGTSQIGGIVGYSYGGQVQNCVALNLSVTANLLFVGRVVGDQDGNTLQNNYARALGMTLTLGGTAKPPVPDANGEDGEDVIWDDWASSGAWWSDDVLGPGFTFGGTPWMWDDSEGLPKLWFMMP